MREPLMKMLLSVLLVAIPSFARAEGPECFPAEVLPDNLFPTVRLETTTIRPCSATYRRVITRLTRMK